MSFIKEFFRSIARTFGRIFAYAIIGLIIYFIASNFVSAKSYRIRAYNNNDVELFNTTTNTSPSASGLMVNSYVNMNNGNMSANNTTYFSFDITFGVRTCMTQLGVNECLLTYDVGQLYWVDSGGSVHQINDICNITATRTKTFETSQNTILWQYRVVGSCAFSPNSTLTGFLLKSYYTYQNTSFTGTANKSAISLSSFDISQNPSEGQQIIDNANKNAQNIINAINNSNQEVITNIQNLDDSIQNLDSSIEDLNFSVTDNTPPSDMNFFSDIGLSDDTPISNLILMPITLLNAFNSGVSGTCRPFNLGALYGSDLIMPCINIESRLGSNLWSSIDAITSIFIIYELAMLIVSVFNDITSLKDGFNGLYTPKHEGYKARHSADYERVDD